MSMHERRVKAADRVGDHMEMKEVMEALKKRDAEITTFAQKASEEIKNLGAMSTETKSALEKLSTSGTELQERLLNVEQKLARRQIGTPEAKSLGKQFTESDQFKGLVNGNTEKARFEVKATITSATTDTAGSAGDLIVPDHRPDILQPAQRELTIRDLLMPGTTASNAIEFVQETGFNNGAAPVAEGGTKPQSDLKFELLTTPVRTIAHWFAASKQVLSDVPLLMSYINTRAIYGLKLVEEGQILTGDGTGQNLLGVIPQAADFSQSTLSVTATDTKIDTLRRASLQVRLAEYRPTFAVLNPIDWADMELTKDSEGRYIWINVQQGGTMVMWRLNVIETTAVDPGEFLVGATMGAQVFDREMAAIEVATQHANFFTENLVAIRAEERLALAVNRPECFVHGYFDLGASPTLNA